VTIGATAFTNDAATSLTINNTNTGAANTGTAAEGIVTVDMTDAALATLAFTGTAATTVALGADTATTFTITDSDSGAVIVTPTSFSAATITATNSGTGTLTIGSFSGSSTLATLDLNGSVAATVSADTLATGVTVAGSTDNAVVSLSLTGATGTHSDNITLGNGNDSVTVLGGGAATATENITLGNGGTATTHNVVDLSGNASIANVVVGTGMNVVTMGSGVDTVTFGTHAASATVFDTVAVTATTQSYTPQTTSSQLSINTASLDVIKGLVAGDTISFAGLASGEVAATATNLAGVAGDVVFAHGTYVGGSTNSFTLNSSGADTLMTYDSSGHTASGGNFVSVVLVGTSFTSAIAHTVTSTLHIA